MGYNTSYKLTVIPNDYENEVIDLIIKRYGFNPFINSPTTWYEFISDMREISKQVQALLLLDGNGAETEDIWRKAWVDGVLVIDWHLSPINRPEPEPEMLAKLETALAVQKKRKRQERIKELQDELTKLQSEDLGETLIECLTNSKELGSFPFSSLLDLSEQQL